MFRKQYFYLDHGLQSIDPVHFKEAKTATDTDTYQDGDIVEAWDHVFIWTPDCVPLRKWEEWRLLGDRLADAALPEIIGPGGSSQETDLLGRLRSAAQQPDSYPAAFALWQHVNQRSDKFVWPDDQQIARGQAVFYRYAPQILASLLQFSLSAGFSSPRISRILNLASYLVPPMESTAEGEAPRISKESNDRSFQRLMETTQWVVDCMGPGALNPGGLGWQATVRVRLLHTLMRWRTLGKSRKDWETTGFSHYNEKTDGVAISQEDMIATLTAFSAAPLLCLIKTGLTPTKQECEDWTALWRVIGYYFGIDLEVLGSHFSDWERNKRMNASVLTSIFAGESDPPPPCHFPFEAGLIPNDRRVKRIVPKNTNADPYASPATLPVLFCICNRWPIPFTFEDHCAATRFLMGPTLSDWLSVPETSWLKYLQYRVGTYGVHLPSLFSRVYRPGWDLKRRKAMRSSVEFSVRQELGNRTSKFRPRVSGSFLPAKEGDEFGGVDQGGNLGTALYEWITLYAEAVGALFAFTLLWPISIPWVFYVLVLSDRTS